MPDEKLSDARHQSLSSMRLLTIMERMSKKRFPARLTDLAEELSMTQPTVLRYLNALCSTGYAYQDPHTGNYALTWKICCVGHDIQNTGTLRNIVSPYLNELAQRLNIGTLLSTESSGNIAYLDLVLNPANSMETMLRIGKDAPIHAIASGKVLLSRYTQAQIRAIIEEKGLLQLTENTLTDLNLLISEILAVRDKGYAFDNEECEVGHRCISVPLYDYTGKITAAISAFDITEALPDERIMQTVLPALKKAAQEISYLLGYDAGARP